MSAARRPVLWLALGVFLAYLLTSSGGFDVSDAVLRYETARSWLAGEGGALAPKYAWVGTVVVPDGRAFSFYGPLQSALMVPILLAVRLLPAMEVDPSVMETAAISLSLFPIVSTAAIVLVYASLPLLGFSRRASLLATIAIAFGGIFWYYARMGQEENLVGLAFALWLYGAARLAADRLFPATAMACGAMIALATRWAAVPLLLVLAAASGLLLHRFRARLRLSDLGLAALLVLSTAALLLSYNQHRFGSWLETGYGLYFQHLDEPMFALDGYGNKVAALLVSPYRGLLLYSPITLLALAATLLVRPATARLVALTAAATLLAALLLAAAFFSWTSGHAWGPRYLVAPQILLAPALATCFERWRPGARLLIPLAFLQFLSVLLPGSTEEYHRFLAVTRDGETCGEWKLTCSPIYLRPGFAARALGNTLADRPGVVLADRPYVAPELVLETSDYRTLFWWPFRVAFRLRLFPLWLAWAITALLAAAAAGSLQIAFRHAAALDRACPAPSPP